MFFTCKHCETRHQIDEIHFHTRQGWYVMKWAIFSVLIVMVMGINSFIGQIEEENLRSSLKTILLITWGQGGIWLLMSRKGERVLHKLAFDYFYAKNEDELVGEIIDAEVAMTQEA